MRAKESLQRRGQTPTKGSMRHAARVAVVVPAFRESRLIQRTLGRVPSFVDQIVVVDDASDDATADAARSSGDPRVSVLVHPENRGVGAAIVTGYRHALDSGADVLCVMAGDDQMHPDDLARVADPVCLGHADYVKGNRFVHTRFTQMPWERRLAGKLLSLATRVATGLDVDDCQCGYTALAATAARRLPLEQLWPRFGYPNDLLAMLADRGCSVQEVAVEPVYADEQSGVRPWHALVVLGIVGRAWLRSIAAEVAPEITTRAHGRRFPSRSEAPYSGRSTGRAPLPRAEP
jgi:hypothetical protein